MIQILSRLFYPVVKGCTKSQYCLKVSLSLLVFVLLTQIAFVQLARAASNASSHITYVIITIDSETPSIGRKGYFPFPEQLDAAINKEKVGISKMIDIADGFQMPITFFVDVYEYARFGKEAIKEIVHTIKGRGHDVQLHTHPEWIGTRLYMNEYSLSEQVEIIREGRELLYEWLGEYPVVHRTGTYAANEDTIEALKRNSIFYDSTWFYSNPNCRMLSHLGFPKNAIAKRQSIIEFPVTVFRIGEWTSFLGLKLPPIFRFKKVDIDSCTIRQIKNVLNQLEKYDVDVVTLFLHSHSFVNRWEPDQEKRKADFEDINDFQEALRLISQNENMRVISAKELVNMYEAGQLNLSGVDYIPTINEKINILQYGRKKLGITRHNFKNYLVGSTVFLLILGGIFMILVLKKGR